MRVKKQPPPQTEPEDYAEERIPFDVVLRKLVNTKPAHKAAARLAAKKGTKTKK